MLGDHVNRDSIPRQSFHDIIYSVLRTDICHCFETAERSEHGPVGGGSFLWGHPVAANRICEACHQIVKTQSRLTIDSGFSNEKKHGIELMIFPGLTRELGYKDNRPSVLVEFFPLIWLVL